MIINLQFNKSTHEIIDAHEPFAEITGMCVAKYLNEDENYINLEVFIDEDLLIEEVRPEAPPEDNLGFEETEAPE